MYVNNTVPGSGGGTFNTGGFNYTVSGPIVGGASTGPFTKEGAGSLTAADIRTTAITVNGGALVVSAGRDANNKVSTTNSLSIASGATLDLNDDDLVVDYTNQANPGQSDPQQLTNVQGWITSAYNGGQWNGKGLRSSIAGTATPHKMALGFAEASAAGITGSFDGQGVDGSTIVVRYTLAGDFNLDGTVGPNDFTAMAQNFGSSGQTWVTGDFNYDGVVNALDFNALASNFGQTVTAPPVLGSLVPEPASIVIAAAALLGMRRRRI